MEMKYCPKCGKQVSSRAITCPECGINLNSPSYCPDCHQILPENAEICPNCGCPVAEIDSRKKKKKTGNIIAIIVIALILISGISSIIIDRRNAANYEAKLESISYTMLDGAADAEEAGNLIKAVWYNSIYKKSDSQTDRYTRANNGKGAFYDDFNDALGCLFSDPAFIKQTDSIKKNQQEVISKMKSMKNPPSEYKEAYEELKVYYNNYLKMTDLIINPSGSLQSFSDKFIELDDATVSSYKRVMMYIDD